MQNSKSKFSTKSWLALAVVGAQFLVWQANSQAPATPQSRKGAAFFDLRERSVQVNKGRHRIAVKYYLEEVKVQTGLDIPDDADPAPTMPDPLNPDKDELNFIVEGFPFQRVLDALGYPDVTAIDLHELSSEDLMKKSPTTIVASRFFAPKVSDVSTPSREIPKGGFGWRKLVVLTAKDGPLKTKGIEAAYILQNTFTESAVVDPYDSKTRVSGNTQVILTRGGPTTGIDDDHHAAYFMLFGPLVKSEKKVLPDGFERLEPKLDASGGFIADAQLQTNLFATFDIANRKLDPETGNDGVNYFTPNACLDCHGGRSDKSRGKLNYLDTDHWYDRVHPNYGVEGTAPDFYRTEDFTALAASPYGILYDGPKLPTVDTAAQANYDQAFKVLREVNLKIQLQNEVAQKPGEPPSFQGQAVKKWNALHDASSKPLPPYDRGFGEKKWNGAKQDHRKALYFLNRYCYRCHSSVKFNVFDMATVLDISEDIKKRTKETKEAKRWMPQDRILPGFSSILDPTGDNPPTGEMKEFHEILDRIKLSNGL